MSEGVPYADIIIIALIAGFILLRLRSVLGQKTGNDSQSIFKKPDIAAEKVINLSGKALKPQLKEEEDKEISDEYFDDIKDEKIAKTLKAIKDKDEHFSATEFLKGAEMAFEMVFDGFAKGDKDPLKMLLSNDLYKQFESEVEARKDQDSKADSTLVSVSAEDIISAKIQKNKVQIGVTFKSEQINIVRDKDDKIIEGNPSDVSVMQDEWVFERDISSKNPNWKIIDT